jgi:hypothetical protein
MRNKSSFIYGLILLAGMLVFVMLFFPALAHADSDSVFKGYELAFGTTFIDLGSFASGQIEPNMLIGLAYLLPLVAGLLAVVIRKMAFLSGLLFVGATVLLFLIPEMTIATVTVLGNTTEIDVSWVMSFGLYLAAAFAIMGAFLCIYQGATSSRK